MKKQHLHLLLIVLAVTWTPHILIGGKKEPAKHNIKPDYEKIIQDSIHSSQTSREGWEKLKKELRDRQAINDPMTEIKFHLAYLCIKLGELATL